MQDTSMYIVSNSGPEHYDPTYLLGPTVPDWKAYCESLAAETSAKAIEFATKGYKNEHGNENTFNCTVCEYDLSAALVAVLLTKGYCKIKFPEYDFGWHDEVDEGYLYPEVTLFNLQGRLDEMEERIAAELRDSVSTKDGLSYWKELHDGIREDIAKLGGTPKINTDLMSSLNKFLEGVK